MSNWILKHKETISLILVVLIAIVGAAALGMVFVTITSVWYALRYGMY